MSEWKDKLIDGSNTEAIDWANPKLKCYDVNGNLMPNPWANDYSVMKSELTKFKHLAAKMADALENIARNFDGYATYSGSQCADIASKALSEYRDAVK